jgi:hypothetical protein
MIPSNGTIHRGRYLILLIGLYLVFFLAGMMTLGALALDETALRWSRFGVIVFCWVAASGIARASVRRGKPRWLLKFPPQA